MIRLRKELGHGKKKIAKMLSTKQKGWEWQRGAEATKMKHQKKEAKGTGGEGRSQCRKQLMKGRVVVRRVSVKPEDTEEE